MSFATRDYAPLPRCKNERFFYGNVPHSIIGIVSPLPGKALATYLAIWDRCKLDGHVEDPLQCQTPELLIPGAWTAMRKVGHCGHWRERG